MADVTDTADQADSTQQSLLVASELQGRLPAGHHHAVTPKSSGHRGMTMENHEPAAALHSAVRQDRIACFEHRHQAADCRMGRAC